MHPVQLLFVLGSFLACQGEPSQSIPDGSLLKADRGLPSTIVVADIEEKAAELALKQHERVWDLIPWESDYSQAMQISQETRRPVFLFSMLGDLDGRC